MTDLVQEIKQFFSGRVSAAPQTLAKYSHDASIFEITPQVVVFPETPRDLSKLIQFVSKHKAKRPELSLTPRSGGTDMSGGAVNDSIIVSFDKTFKKITRFTRDSVRVEPGVYYRDLEKVTLDHNVLMPAYPASKGICMVGGMAANNAGGEKSLSYGKVIDYVTGLKVMLRDGKEYWIEPLNRDQLKRKMRQDDLEGFMYKQVFDLVDKHYDAIKAAKPAVTKNSTGYNLWDVWDKETFDLTKLFVGSQGTLGFITQIEFKLVPVKPLAGQLVIFMPTLDHLGDLVNTVLETNPSSFESFDDHTLSFSLRFFPYFLSRLGWTGWLSLGLSLLPDLRYFVGGLPKLILLVEYEGNTQEEINQKLHALQQKVARFSMPTKVAYTKKAGEKYWTLRRESFNILRHNVQGGHTAPFIDDFVVPPPHLPEFLPKLTKILEGSDLLYTVAGHLGNGNFHIIPLMKLQNEPERDKIAPVMEQVNALVMQYQGSLSGEHNDGLVRGPFLHQMYSKKMLGYFTQIKRIFDPQNIFNPHKKMDATWDYSKAHIRQRFE